MLIFSKDAVFDALVFFCQDVLNNEMSKKLNLVFLETLYFIFASFDPKWLTSLQEDEIEVLMKNLA